MSIWKRLGRVGRGKAKVWGQNLGEAIQSAGDALVGTEDEDAEVVEAELHAASEASRAKRSGVAPADLVEETPVADDRDAFGFKEYKPKKRTL